MSKLLAAWLVALIVLPFTAPFPTCDARDLFGDAHQQRATTNALSPSAVTLDDSATLFPPSTVAHEQMRHVLMADAYSPRIEDQTPRLESRTGHVAHVARQHVAVAVLRL